MPDNGVDVAKLVTDAIAVFKTVARDQTASQADRDAAADRVEDLLLLLARQAMIDYEGRTAALTGLIAELADFTGTVQVKNPILAHLDELDQIAKDALALFKAEKQKAHT